MWTDKERKFKIVRNMNDLIIYCSKIYFVGDKHLSVKELLKVKFCKKKKKKI